MDSPAKPGASAPDPNQATVEPGRWQPKRSSVIAWMLYDLANTTFALGVTSRYFGLWVIEGRGGADWQISLAQISAMLVVIMIGPWIGLLSDHRGRRKPYLVGSTLICVAATALLATWGVGPSLVLYAIATAGFNVGALVYDAMLPDVSTPETAGRVSGTGVALGYAGSALALGLGILMLAWYDDHAAVFRALGAAFLLFALPAFFLIRERPRQRAQGKAPGILRSPLTTIQAWRNAAREPGVVRFLLARYLYSDAINTVFLFNALFAKLEMRFTDAQVNVLAVLAIVFAGLGAAGAGWAVDRFGPKRVLQAALLSQLFGLASAITAAAGHIQALGWLVAVGGGAGIGMAWASDRVFMTRLTPAHLIGEFFGLYATVGRFATLLGPLVWALVADVLDLGRTAALTSLGIFIVAAWFVLKGVSDAPNIESPEAPLALAPEA